MPCFLICHNELELRSKPCFKRLFEKSPLKIRKNFTRTYHFVLLKAFWFPKDFSRKALCSGFGADSSNIQCIHKKHGNAVLFYIFGHVISHHRKGCRGGRALRRVFFFPLLRGALLLPRKRVLLRFRLCSFRVSALQARRAFRVLCRLPSRV